MRILLTLAGLAIGFAVPVLAFNFSGDVKALGEFSSKPDRSRVRQRLLVSDLCS
jgi:hypothetical protein